MIQRTKKRGFTLNLRGGLVLILIIAAICMAFSRFSFGNEWVEAIASAVGLAKILVIIVGGMGILFLLFIPFKIPGAFTLFVIVILSSAAQWFSYDLLLRWANNGFQGIWHIIGAVVLFVLGFLFGVKLSFSLTKTETIIG